jgi:hypothetical protein
MISWIFHGFLIGAGAGIGFVGTTRVSLGVALTVVVVVVVVVAVVALVVGEQ